MLRRGDFRKFKRSMPLTWRYAEANGWSFQDGAGGHNFLVKGFFRYAISSTVGDRLADLNARADLRRYDRTGAVNGNPKEKVS